MKDVSKRFGGQFFQKLEAGIFGKGGPCIDFLASTVTACSQAAVESNLESNG